MRNRSEMLRRRRCLTSLNTKRQKKTVSFEDSCFAIVMMLSGVQMRPKRLLINIWRLCHHGNETFRYKDYAAITIHGEMKWKLNKLL